MHLKVVDPVDPAPLLSVQLDGWSVAKRQILGSIDIMMQSSETLALIGPSGIGKTSLLRIISGLETDYRGQVKAPPTIAMVFQEPTLLPWRTLAQNITITTGLSDLQAQNALAEVGLSGRDGDFPNQLSLGEQRRMALARAFAIKPDLLLLDEPFVSLDPPLVQEMMRLFAILRARHSVATIFVTHVEAEAKQLASRIIELRGTPAQIVADRQNKGAYFQLSASGVTSSGS
ncbi:ATP-binding cassette domain-containing protein [Parasulfitobacter algicola]|uniref:ATP-binding cassette domain-containing protein n=1 Tax=Parasulfitobacter algicola TaxID=2614809 RepID=A0ABX2IV92_9RHOB|nr:ATP-binding cassette domain-containing protein [Sulfitobacter algicola]NSX56225.1 ATP-binding cassette domain-containing protein [Sulfitobacter algicola]